MPIPQEIPVEQFIEACRAFSEAVGLDPAVTLFPLVLTGDAIHFSVLVSNEDGGKQLAHTMGGNLGSVLSATGKIEVAR